MGMMFCRGCGKEIHETAPMCPHCGAPQNAPAAANALAIPDGVKGWSWGAFLLNWVWAIGNKTWIGLLALVPYVGFIMAIVLGFKGREWAWKSRQWDSLDHFNRIQKKWSFWGVILWLIATVIGIGAAVAIPAYVGYKAQAAEATAVQQQELSRQVHAAELQKQAEDAIALALAQQQEEARKAQTEAATAAQQAAREPSQTQADQGTVEPEGICKGLDMVVTADQYECQSRKFSQADGELNGTYKRVMASLDDAHKAGLKREQIAWIKEKESKCAKAGKEVEGGSMEGLVINDCKITMTEERLVYLHAYR